jgi:DnaJ-domain-containing protein 1
MDVLDRIAAVLRALFAHSESTDRPRGAGPGVRPSAEPLSRPADPDLAAAWDELNEYLGSDRREAGGGSPHGGDRKDSRGPRSAPMPPESLRPDYANLEVPFGADIETVRRSYKRLVLHYHPDRHAGSPETLRVATEITKKVNESFERIRSFQERTGTGDH